MSGHPASNLCSKLPCATSTRVLQIAHTGSWDQSWTVPTGTGSQFWLTHSRSQVNYRLWLAHIESRQLIHTGPPGPLWLRSRSPPWLTHPESRGHPRLTLIGSRSRPRLSLTRSRSHYWLTHIESRSQHWLTRTGSQSRVLCPTTRPFYGPCPCADRWSLLTIACVSHPLLVGW